MIKISKYAMLSLAILMVLLILTVSLASCTPVTDNSNSSDIAYAQKFGYYSLINLFVNPLLSPLNIGTPSIIQSDTLKYMEEIPNPFRFMTNSDIDKYYKELKAINGLNDDENRILATVNGEAIYQSDIDTVKALAKLFAPAYFKLAQQLQSDGDSASETEVTASMTTEFADSTESSTDGSASDVPDGVPDFSYLDQLTGNEPTKGNSNPQKFNDWLNISDSQYLEWLITNKVIIQNALEREISVSDDELYTQAKIQYDIINKSNQYLNKMSLKAYGMNKDTYIRNVLMPIMKEYDLVAMYENLYMSENHPYPKKSDETKSILKEHVDSLILESDIQYQ